MSSRRETYNKIAPEDVVLLDKLGQGEFGVVHRGRWSSPSGQKEAAVKCLHGEEEERVRLLQEAFVMGQFKHPHVVQLYGVVNTADTVRRGWHCHHNCGSNTLSTYVRIVCGWAYGKDCVHVSHCACR